MLIVDDEVQTRELLSRSEPRARQSKHTVSRGIGSARRARTLGARPCSADAVANRLRGIEENHAREWYPVEMIVRDWRDADVADTQLLYAREQDFWVRELTWDASNSWREIEQARTTWGLPGRIAIDHKRTVRGWSYYMPDGETLHIGGIAAETKDATAALVDACLEMSAVPPRPLRVSCFVPDRAEGFETALVERGFTCEHYHYLSRTLTHSANPGAATQAEGWREGDLQDAAELLRIAYGEHGRHFAPRGTLTEWEHYARGLVERPGCGDSRACTHARCPRRRQHGRARAHHTHRARHDPPGAGRRASCPTPRRLRAAARGRGVPPGATARRASGDAAGGGEEHGGAEAL